MPDKIHILRTRNEQSPRCSGYPVSKSGKFRSMIPNAEERLEELLDQNEMDGPVF